MVHRANPYADIPSLYDMYCASIGAPAPMSVLAWRFPQHFERSRAIPMDLPVNSDYVIGPGDGLEIDLWAEFLSDCSASLDREGRVSLPEAGRFSSVDGVWAMRSSSSKLLRTQLPRRFSRCVRFELRTVRVYVVGERSGTGAYDISSLSTP